MAVSPWNDSLQDDPDNYVIVTQGSLAEANPNDNYRDNGFGVPAWFEEVIAVGMGRTGSYSTMQTLSGDDAANGIFCCIAHAEMGEQAVQSWNTSTEGPDPDVPPVCRTLPDVGDAGTADTQRTTTGYAIAPHDGGPSEIGGSNATVFGAAYWVWYLPVRDNLPPWGALFDFSLDPVDYGYPEDAVIEWESPVPELLGVEVADGEPVEGSDFTNRWVLNGIGPIYNGLDDPAPWPLGFPGEAPDPPDPERPFVYWEYGSGDVAWQEISDTAGWDGHEWNEDYDPEAATATDAVISAWPTVPVVGSAETASRAAVPALRFLLRAPRFRWIYTGPTVIPVTRQYPRDDGRGISSAPRLHPPTKANRLAGGYS